MSRGGRHSRAPTAACKGTSGTPSGAEHAAAGSRQPPPCQSGTRGRRRVAEAGNVERRVVGREAVRARGIKEAERCQEAGREKGQGSGAEVVAEAGRTESWRRVQEALLFLMIRFGRQQLACLRVPSGPWAPPLLGAIPPPPLPPRPAPRLSPYPAHDLHAPERNASSTIPNTTAAAPRTGGSLAKRGDARPSWRRS